MGISRRDDREATSSSLVDFIVGAALAGWGATLVSDRLVVSSAFQINFYGYHQSSFAPVFAVFLMGVFLLALGRTWLAKLFMVTGAALTMWGAVNSLELHYTPAPMIQTFIMFSMLVGGLGMVLKSMVSSRA